MTATDTPRPPVVLIVDDLAANRDLLHAYLDDLSYDVRHASDGIEALESIDEIEPDLILLDVDMPRMNGIAVTEVLKAHPVRRLIPIIILTASQDRSQRIAGLAAGADDYLSKPFDSRELFVRAGVLLRDRKLNKKLDATEGVLYALARAIEARDRYTIHHAERVGRFAQEIGRIVEPRSEGEHLYQGGVLHDLGKIAIPDAILLKPGPLSDEEFAKMRTHSAEGELICLTLRSVADFLPIIRHHHERIDGRGYPDHRVGTDIPLGARIVAVADGWDAMTSDRPYRAGKSTDEALGILRAGAGSQWDAAAVEVFTHLLEAGTIAKIVADQANASPR